MKVRPVKVGRGTVLAAAVIGDGQRETPR